MTTDNNEVVTGSIIDLTTLPIRTQVAATSGSPELPTTATPLFLYSPPPMPSPRPSGNPAIAAVERAFADYLVDQLGGARRVRFMPQVLWDYKFYCLGYTALPGDSRSPAHRDSARRNYTVRREDDNDNDNDDIGNPDAGSPGTL
jgi:hypothetical protein